MEAEQQAFHDAMEKDPHDRTTRLVYADWLEEHGNEKAAQRLRWWAKLKAHLEAPNAPHDRLPAAADVKLPVWVRRLTALQRIHQQVKAHNPDFGIHAKDFHHVLASIERDAIGVEPPEEWDKNRIRTENWSVRGPNGSGHYGAAIRGDTPSILMFAALHALRGQTEESRRLTHPYAGSVDAAHDWLGDARYVDAGSDTRDFAARSGEPIPLARPVGMPIAWWMDPHGELHSVDNATTHEQWLEKNRNSHPTLAGTTDIGGAYDKGWHRVTHFGTTLFAENPKVLANRAQLDALKDHGIMTKSQGVELYGPKEGVKQRVRLSREDNNEHRVNQDFRLYTAAVRPRLHQTKIGKNSPEEHALMHQFILNRGLKVEQSPVSYYDEGLHTLYHPEPTNKSAVVQAYARWAERPVKLARPVKTLIGPKTDEEDAFHQQMRDDPDDRTTRLVYADWLQEHGKEKAAQRIRWWVKLKEFHASRAGRWQRARVDVVLPDWVHRLELARQVHAGIKLHHATLGHDRAQVLTDAMASVERQAYGVEDPSEGEIHRSNVQAEADDDTYQDALDGSPAERLIMAAFHVVRSASAFADPPGALYNARAWLGGVGGAQPFVDKHRHAAHHFAKKDDPTKLERQRYPGPGAANRGLATDTHSTRLGVVKSLLREAGVEAAVRSVLAHNDERGVRPAVAAISGTAIKPALARYVGAWLGLMTGERKYTVFRPGEGEDTLHVLESPHPPSHVGEYLRRSGVPAFTLEPSGAGTRIFIANPMNIVDVQGAASGLHSTSHNQIPGTAVRLGDADSDAESRAAFRQVIHDSESTGA